MFSELWVIKLTPLLTGVSTVPTVLRVLWRDDVSRVTGTQIYNHDVWTVHHLLFLSHIT